MGECESCEDALKIIPDHFIVKIQAGSEYHTQTFAENAKYFKRVFSPAGSIQPVK